MKIVYIHTGILSHENGAKGPLQIYFDLASTLGIAPTTGQHYGDDKLEIPDEDWPVAEQLLIESNMLYRIRLEHDAWQNIRTDAVRKLLAPYEHTRA